MPLTRAADYAVRVMIHLAGLPPGTRVSRDDLAQAAECPEQFLSKVLQGLARSGLIVSHRGNTGGFELSANRRSASMLDVARSHRGPAAPEHLHRPGQRMQPAIVVPGSPRLRRGGGSHDKGPPDGHHRSTGAQH
jgi:Rrf2 family protein